ncbi:MAG: ureidoglycolate lyase [Geitlerinemataceae cyanobacterium]
MGALEIESDKLVTRSIIAEPISSEAFAVYGQVIAAGEDGKRFDETDAQLDLSAGTPRFYIMRLEAKGRGFDRITRHGRCTQCLGSLNGRDWWIGVAPPDETSEEPDRDLLRVFKVPGDCFIKLDRGTWHAGPYFEGEPIDFYNLELSDTNEIDHFTHVFSARDRCRYEIVDAD